MRSALLLSLLSLTGHVAGAPAPSAKGPAAALLESAISAAGGARRLGRYPAFEWHAKAVVHAGERAIELEGRWRVRPPDQAVVETQEIGRGAGSRRRMVLAGDHGWSEIGGKTRPLPADLVAHERDQFYLYHLMRLVPLRSTEFSLALLEADPLGHRGLRVSRPGNREVDLYFDDAARLARAVTRLKDPGTGREVLEELQFRGTIGAAGLRWPRAIEITWDGRPYFTLELTEFKPLPGLDPSLLEGPP